MVGHEEISDIMEHTGLSFGEIAEPYPDRILEGDLDYTFGWVLRRTGDRCRFLDESSCQIYPVRPWICRTYPFVLDENGLTIHPCEGTGQNVGSGDAEKIAQEKMFLGNLFSILRYATLSLKYTSATYPDTHNESPK